MMEKADDFEEEGQSNPNGQNPTLIQLFGYFLWLGALGFGGPVALANYMRRDLAERRGWLTEAEYDDGLALSASCPGPLAYQLGVYCGYIRFGILGGLVVAIAFALPPFVLVTGIADLYDRFGGLWQVRAAFYGVGPIVVALILKACWNLGKKTLHKDSYAWLMFLAACGITVITQKELTAIFLVGGVIGTIVFSRSRKGESRGKGTEATVLKGSSSNRNVSSMVVLPAWLGLSGTTTKLFLFFLKTGCLVFGSGLVIVPFLQSYVVEQYQWLGDQAFLDAVAIGMVSPGPVVITATFVGYVVDGFGGAVAATVGIFTPAVFFTAVATPILRRYRDNPYLQGFVRGVTITVVGVLVGTTWLVAQEAIGDGVTAAICVASLFVLFKWERIPDPIVVLIGGCVGFLAFWLRHAA